MTIVNQLIPFIYPFYFMVWCISHWAYFPIFGQSFEFPEKYRIRFWICKNSILILQNSIFLHFAWWILPGWCSKQACFAGLVSKLTYCTLCVGLCILPIGGSLVYYAWLFVGKSDSLISLWGCFDFVWVCVLCSSIELCVKRGSGC